MKIRIDFDGLLAYVKNWNNSSEKIFSLEKEIRNILDGIPSNWIGKDSDSFISKTSTLLNEIHTIAECTKENTEFFYKVLNDYEDNEDKYAELIGKV